MSSSKASTNPTQPSHPEYKSQIPDANSVDQGTSRSSEDVQAVPEGGAQKTQHLDSSSNADITQNANKGRRMMGQSMQDEFERRM